MAERKWTNLDCIAYLFNAFAVYTDMELSDDEKRVIATEMKKYVADKDGDAHFTSLNKTLGWFKEDLDKDIKEKQVNGKESTVIGTFINISGHLKDSFDVKVCQAIHDDLVRIGKADGNYDKREQTWAETFAKITGCQH